MVDAFCYVTAQRTDVEEKVPALSSPKDSHGQHPAAVVVSMQVPSAL